jgi:pimeloyl-ACP methyl ester carboxylesterase
MRADIDGVPIHYEVSGQGPAVILLHGFPDTGQVWRHQAPALTAAGFQVIVPDLRGYGRSGKPADVSAYTFRHLIADTLGVLDDLGITRAHVVGHDWGASLAWALAAHYPQRVARLAALSVGHPAAFAAAGIAQREKSWYMLLFQFPGTAEQWLTQDDWANFRGWARHPDADSVIAELEASGSLTPGLNWYRANVPPESLLRTPGLPPVQAPTLGLWSSRDIALTEAQMAESKNYVRGPWRYERLDDVGHWMQLEAAEHVNQLLVDFLHVALPLPVKNSPG